MVSHAFRQCLICGTSISDVEVAPLRVVVQRGIVELIVRAESKVKKESFLLGEAGA